MVGRLLPATAGVLTVLGFLRWLGEEQGLYGPLVGIALLMVAAIAVIAGLLLYFARWLDRDYATRREVEGTLSRSSRYFELSRDLVCTAGFDGYYRELNASWTQALGWTEAELRSRPFVEFVHPDDRESTELESAALAEGGVTVDFVNRYATKDGGWRWIDWKAVANVEEGLIYASARDITHRKRAEAALEASERQTRLILETAHDAFISISADGLIIDWNPQAETTFGWSRHEVLGRELAATVLPETHREAHRRGIQRFLATGEGQVIGQRLEVTALHRDGREFPIELTISPLETKDGYRFNAFLRDITDRNRAQEDLALARDQAVANSQMKSMFVANVSHEIRTPMNGVIGMIALLLDTDLDDEQREYAQTVSSSGEALLNIIDDILDFSKIEAGKLELDQTDFDLRDAVERASGMLAARAQEKGLELVVAVDPDVPALVHGDAARLRQVISNFVSNAIKFTAQGEVVVRVSTVPGQQSAATRVRLTVSDTGIGIQADALDRLFTPFSQADSSTTRKYGGTGLGLAISRQLVELMDGQVGADSEPGQGSSFWFEVPLVHAEHTTTPAEEDHELAGLRVLVVDDNTTSRRTLQRQLGSWQMSCQVAGDASAAIDLLASAAAAGMPYTVALLDQNMPDIDGPALARTIRARPALQGIRLILLTPPGGRTDTLPEAALDGTLSKPVRQSRLYEELQAVITGASPTTRRARNSPAGGPDVSGPGVGPYILVAEDTPVNQQVAIRMLEKSGFRPHIAANGRKALQALTEGSYAAVLMDCQMPELDGYETTREIRRREHDTGQHIPIIAMTANSMQGERERCLAAGMDDYLSKPLRKQALNDALTRWIPTPPVSTTHRDTPPAAPGGPELLHETVIAELEGLDGEVLPALLTLYFDEAASSITELAGAISGGQPLTVAQSAHKLNGSSSALGAQHVATLAAELQATATANDLSGADQLLDRLRAGIDETRKAFRSRTPQPRRPSVS